MVKIEAVIQPSRLADVTAALRDLDVARVSISEVLSHGGSHSQKVVYRGFEYATDTPMMKLELLVSSLCADEAVEAISRAARTRRDCDDGAILVFEVAEAVSIRSGARGEFAMS